jgi:hypothetical protein
MTTRQHDSESRDEIDTDLLDALVDGELADDEQRALLSRLDAEPEGWRRLALTFVEDQRWRRELRAVVAEAGASPMLPLTVVATASARRLASFRRFAGPLLVTAVALLLGAAIGYGIRDDDGARRVADRADSDTAPIIRNQQPPDQNIASAPPASKWPGPPPVAMQLARIGFADPASGEIRQIEAAVTGPPEAPVLRLNEPIAALPEGLRVSLERAAFELVTSQRVYPLRLETGEQIMLVGRDEVDVRLLPTERPVY